MEHPAGELFLIGFQDMQQFVLCLAAMDHQGQPRLYRPLDLLLKSSQLLFLIFAAPIEIEATLANSNISRFLILMKILLKPASHHLQNLLPVGAHLFRLQPDHRKAIAWIVAADTHHALHGGSVDTGNEDCLHPRVLGATDHLRQVVLELLAVEVRMRIDKVTVCHNPNIS